MSHWGDGMPPSGRHDPYEPPDHAGEAPVRSDDDGTAPYPITWERDPVGPGAAGASATQSPGLPGGDGPDGYGRGADWRGAALADEGWPDEDWPPRRPRGRGVRGLRDRRKAGSGRPRWPMIALIALAAAFAGAAVVLTGGSSSGHSGGQASAARSPAARTVPSMRGMAPSMQDTAPSMRGTAPPMRGVLAPAPAGQGPLTVAQASQVLAAYTTANNAANAERSDMVLAMIETGSSYAIDAGIYRAQQAENQAPYPAFGPQQAQYYIPRETAYPRWFVVQVSNADLASPAKITGTEYLLFTQAAPGALWKNAVEPFVIMGEATPQVALGAGGLATPVTAATPLAVPMGQIAQVTASSLDGAGPLPNPGNLADLMDRAFWQSKLPASSVTDSHAPADGGVYGLATAGGGALLFYTDAAELTLTAPAGQVMHLTVPGYYSPAQALSQAGIGYLEQFATYDPPSGGSGLRVVADYSGVTSAG